MSGELIYRKAKIDDANAITKFCLGVIRHSFTVRQKIGPQEYLLSNENEIDYLKIRQKSLNLSTTITKIAIDVQSDQIIGYIEFGPKNQYFNDLNCTHEILCYFVNPNYQGKGVGKYLLASVMQEAHDGGTFTIGYNNVGVLTMQGNQTIPLYYEKSLRMVVAKIAEIPDIDRTHDTEMVGQYVYRKAKTEDLNAITDFVVGCIRYAFTVKNILGPQEYYKSDVFPKDYYKIRQGSLDKPTTLSSMAIDPVTNNVVGYIEFGPKKPYFEKMDCTSEILCYFVGSQTQGKGVGRHLLANIIQQAHNTKTFSIGQESVGVLTLRGNPSITTFYKKIGAYPVEEYDFNAGSINIGTTLLLWDEKSVEMFMKSYVEQK